MRHVRPLLSSVVGMTAVVFSALHLSARLDTVAHSVSQAADRSRSNEGQHEPISPGVLYRIAIGNGPATLPAPPAGCIWRVAVVSHARCDERTPVVISRAVSTQSIPPAERGASNRFARWRTERRHRVVLPLIRPFDRTESPGTELPRQDAVTVRSQPSTAPVEFDLAIHDLPADDQRAYVTIRARTLSVEDGLRILWDTQAPPTPQVEQLVAAIRGEWSDRVRPAIAAQFSTEVLREPVDIVLTPLLGQLRDGRVSLDGMVRTDDLRRDLPRPYSAGRPVIYLRSELRPGNRLTTVLAHEAMHLAAAQSRLIHHETSDQELWLSEGLSHFGERLVAPGWSNLDHRLEQWSRNPSDAPLVLDPRFSPERWRDPGCRGAAYLFTDWAARKHGPGFVEAICESPVTGIQAVAVAVDQPAHDLLEEWALACLLVDRPELLEQAGVTPLGELPTAWQPRRLRDEGTHLVTGSAMLLLELSGADRWSVDAAANATAVACPVPVR